MDIGLTVQKIDSSTTVSYTVDRMVNAGFTGRDQEEVRHHLEELRSKGIDVPEKTPLVYPVIANTLSCAAEIEVYGGETSGEIEYVLLVDDTGRVYVGIGSDHTCRALEQTDIPRAKQICPNLMAPTVWDLADVEDHWDDLVMECTVTKDNREILYQKGGLGLLMSPRELMDFVGSTVKGSLNNTVIFSGTVKMETEAFIYADRFSGRLTDTRLNRSLEFSYDIKPMDYMVG
ncbi:DUF2848 family protein [Desulforhopalus singaporensis]|uniref:DUF2848 domain-containing protein n=1 Tax=Desulforhopalus singaporensis TaxID=91360 RepID=A0A1H0RSX8_9BACT|nr:DUF2848 family protein [Desulforhopalus singaporensis]SDP32459.1 Protein of unknown function [Desulforhopalus singaporensis]